ncbi:MAG: PD-(D/E)XK nuclease family protein [Flavobacteriales bacterium]|nr:PD-(D/E)XK nuclease family protein [Flavobacteriales bacterium]MCB9191413.1 PD-(D/E)XK nuclease family protein [Flavobacteriales bacterium]MCB9203961.1 PD-(D/E)XK nuclease family protein [Flavobacteriales bacterium]
MQTFLDDIAAELLKQGGNDFSKTCIVLPNRRAGVFLRDAISRQSNKAIWAPTILSIEDFVFGLSSVVKVDRSTLLFAFYEIYKELADDPQTIELFANWAPVFLSDINELDLNLIDAEDIFAQLHSIERIKKWNPSTGVKTEFQDKHLKFVEKFFPFYEQLRAFLKGKGLGYQGMAFREVAENMDSVVSRSDWDRVWFAGFNALTVSEEHILQAWQQLGNTKLFWDMDAFYADDNMHEAGHYIRRYRSGSAHLKLTPNFDWKGDRLRSETKSIDIVATQRNMMQAQVASSILKNRDRNWTNTALVLNDEQLLLPLLGTLPETLSGVNITMGYGLQHSQSAVFVEHVFRLYAGMGSGSDNFYHQHVAAIENDPFFLLWAGVTSAKDRPNRVNYKQADLATSEWHQQVFSTEWCTVTGFLTRLKALINSVGSKLEKDSIELEFLFLLDKLAQRLLDLTEEFGAIDSVKTLHTFWRQLLRNHQLDFVGEPLTGLQIMGMLETRNLDFEEVIMLGVNEGNLPSTAHSNSYFTFDIRRAYGLACQNERDAVTAYHFYRLMQRAKRVTLIYDQDTDSFGGGEVSRYVKQLLLERPENISIRELHIDQDIPDSVLAPSISIHKTATELNRLQEIADYGISPSALNTFRTCSLKYYLRYVAKVKEADSFEEEMDSAMLGSAIHDALEALYTPFVGKQLTVSGLHEMKKRTEDFLLPSFHKQLKTDEALTGQDLLAFEVAKTYVHKAIDHDLATIERGQEISVVGLERELTEELSITSGGTQRVVSLKGKADRIDQLSDGIIRVIDYKTGNADKKFEIKSKEDFEDSKSDNAFQLLFYHLLYADTKASQQTEPMGFYLRPKEIERKISVSEDKVRLEGSELRDYVEDLVTELLVQLFDPSLPFEQTEDEKRCKYCDFAGFCQRATTDK